MGEKIRSKTSVPVKLGLMPPLTGLVGIYGSEISRAGRIACDEVNAAGGVLGRPLHLEIEDDGSLPESAVQAARKLVDRGCTAIIGNLLSNSRIAVAYNVAEPCKIPYLNFSFYEGSIQSRYFFHFAALPNQQIDRMIPYMRQKFGPRMFFAGNNYEWPRGSIDAAKRALLLAGGEIAGEEYCPIGVDEAALGRLLEHVATAAPQVFVPYFAGVDQVNLLTQFTERGLKQRMAVVMGHYDELMASKLPAKVREGFYSSNSYFMTVDSKENRDYLQRLDKMPGVTGIWPKGNGILTNFGEGAYLCVKAFAQAANAAGSLEAEALVDELATISVTGPQGVVKMDPVTQHATVNTYLSCCDAAGVFHITEKFGAIPSVMPERYSHQRIINRSNLEGDIRLQARMLEQMSEAVILVDLKTGEIVYVNGGAERMFGYADNEMLGLNISTLDVQHNGDEGKTSSQLAAILDHSGKWEGNTRSRRKDGGILWCHAMMSLFTHPAYGEVWMGVYRDITALVASEERIRAGVERLRMVIDATNDGIWDWNPATHEDYLSPRWKAILGYRDDELENVESTFFNLVHPDDRASVNAAVAAHFQHNEPFNIELRMSHKDGSYRWVLSRGEAVRDDKGKVIRMVGSISDITRRKLAEQELIQHRENLEVLVRERTLDLEAAKNEAETANRAKSEFLSRMSHELRTPMNAILGFSQVLACEKLTIDQLEHVDEIFNAGSHLLELINELLDLSRIEAGKLVIVLEPVNANQVVNDAVQIVQSILDQKDLTLINQCAENLLVLADTTRLKQIMLNLFSNAAKYNVTGGRIHITSETIGDSSARIVVTDNGPGISKEKLGRLFNPFERLGAEYGPIEGTGIGLTLSRQLAELMGGKLGVDSQTGVGSSFWVELPQAPGYTVRAADPRGPQLPGGPTTQVLYIEDNASNLRLVDAMFRYNPHLRLLNATNGEYGVELARRYLPQAILLDIHLPGMDGYSVFAALKADPATRDIPVIALSADAMPIDIERGLQAGFVRYLVKPVVMEELIQAIDDAVKQGAGQANTTH